MSLNLKLLNCLCNFVYNSLILSSFIMILWFKQHLGKRKAPPPTTYNLQVSTSTLKCPLIICSCIWQPLKDWQLVNFDRSPFWTALTETPQSHFVIIFFYGDLENKFLLDRGMYFNILMYSCKFPLLRGGKIY